MNLYFDIETIPVQDPEQIAGMRAALTDELEKALGGIKAPGNYKKAESIAEYEAAEAQRLRSEYPQRLEDAIASTGLDGGLGQIACIGWAVEDGPVMSRHVEDLTPAAERDLLAHWFHSLVSAHSGHAGRRPVLIGHNSNAFDIPFIWKRAIVHGVRPPLWFPRDPKPWGDATFDTMTAWAGARGHIGMDRLCKLLGLPGKGGMSGADVWPLVQAGRIADVAEYCRGDVERTRQLHRRMSFEAAA